jgi:hypothetical protein
VWIPDVYPGWHVVWWEWYDQVITSYVDFVVERLAGFNASLAWWEDFVWGEDSSGAGEIYHVEASYAYAWKGVGVGDQAGMGQIDRFRTRGKGGVNGLPVMCPHTAELYLKLEKITTLHVNPSFGWNDMDDIGWGKDSLTLVETFAESSDTEHQQTDYIGDIKTDPATIVDYAGSHGFVVDMNEQFDLLWAKCQGGLHPVGAKITKSNWLLKWNFTYATIPPVGRYIDNGDGTVTDSLTGLMWLQDATLYGKKTWQNAVDFCAALDACGYTDWRLPEEYEGGGAAELDTLGRVDGDPTKEYEADWWLGTPFTNVQPGGSGSYDTYWSSTSYIGYPAYAWYVRIKDGYRDGGQKTGQQYVWPVRGP